MKDKKQKKPSISDDPIFPSPEISDDRTLDTPKLDLDDLPEPPKFNLDDLPEPPAIPSFDESNKDIEINSKKKSAVKPRVDITIPKLDVTANMPGPKKAVGAISEKMPEIKLDDLPGPSSFEKTLPLTDSNNNIPSPEGDSKQKKGFFAKLFGKQKKHPITKEMPPIPNPSDEADKMDDFSKISSTPGIPCMKDTLGKPSSNTYGGHEPISIKGLDDLDDPFVNDKKMPWESFKKEIDTTEHDMKKFIKSDLSVKELEAPKDLAVKKEPLLVPTEPIPLEKVDGIGEKRAKALKKAGIKSVQHLADASHETVAKKGKIPEKHAKKMISHAKRITKKHAKEQEKKLNKKGITDLIDELEKEKREIKDLKKSSLFADSKELKGIRGHDDIIRLLEKLEKKKAELVDYELKLTAKESDLKGVKDTYKRDANYVDNLKRKLDHEVRERTKYLVDMEQEFFKKGQDLAKRQSLVELKEEKLKDVELEIKEKEKDIKKRQHEFEDKAITQKAKEEKIHSLLKELDKQDSLLKGKEKSLEKSEEKYMKRLEILEENEKAAKEKIALKRKELDIKEKELRKKELEISKKERDLEVEDRALDYVKQEFDKQREQLADDQFQQYVHDKLGMLRSGGISINDINATENLRTPESPKGDGLSGMVVRCRQLLGAGKIDEAKLMYNRLREEFYNREKYLNMVDKEHIHNQIRALFDDICLLELN